MKTTFATLLLIVCGTATRADAQGWVDLKKWEEKAVAVRAQGPGGDVFRLEAEASWDKNAPKDPGRFQARLVSANGKTQTHPLDSNDEPGASARRVTFYVPANLARNLRPDAVRFRLSVVDSIDGKTASNELIATSDQFPTPESPFARDERGPFGWGKPLDGSGARPLPRQAPDGSNYVRIVSTKDSAGFFLARNEATNAQVRKYIKGYDPKARSSDEFMLEKPDQPAVNLSAKQATDYVTALSRGDSSGVLYRLPAVDEWLRAAKAGRRSKYWWGNDPTFPSGANFLGPEPTLPGDATAEYAPRSGFRPNPWGLFHTFGNVAEWARKDSGFVRLGGHFRTAPEDASAEVLVNDPNSTGTDPFVGVRPAFDLSAEEGANLARRALGDDPAFREIAVTFQADRATLQLSGTVSNARSRKTADRKLERLWFVAAVVNEIQAPAVEPGKLARLSPTTKPLERTKPLGRTIDRATLPVRWGPILPVDGSEWWVNIFWNGGRHAHVLMESKPGDSTTLTVMIDRERVPEGVDLSVALSLGAQAASADDPRIVSNFASVPAAR